MRTIRRLIHGEIIRAVSFVAIGFLALFVFFDLVDQLQTLSRNKFQGYQLQHALLKTCRIRHASYHGQFIPKFRPKTISPFR